MKPISLDTSAEVQRIHYALLRTAPAGLLESQ